MSEEQLVWRPNHISPEEWNAKTREEQIAYWDSRPRKEAPKRHMTDVIGLYEGGAITSAECFLLLCKLAADDEVEWFVSVCPPQVMSLLLESLAAYGEDEAAWPRTVAIVCYAPWVSAEDVERSQGREQEAIWHGVRILKSHLMKP